MSGDCVVVVHSFAHAKGALKSAARAGRKVTLVSAPGSASYLGPGWFNAVLAAAREEAPEAQFSAFLDCGENVAAALAALRAEVPAIVFTGREDVARRLADIALQHGVGFARERPAAAIDLGEDFFASEEDAAQHLAEILAESARFC